MTDLLPCPFCGGKARECEEEIKEALFKYYWPKIQRGIVSGLPEWWKGELAKSQFDILG